MQNKITFILFILSAHLVAQSNWVNYANDHIIWDMALDNDHLWVGTQGGLIRLDIQTGEKEIYQAWNSGLRGTGIKEVEVADDGRKWLGGENGGLFSLEGANWEHFYYINTGDTLIQIVNLKLDNSGNPWFFSNRNGNCTGCVKLISYNGNEFINHSNILNDLASVSGIRDFTFIDNEEMWIVTDNGLIKYDGTEVSEIFDASNIPLATNEGLGLIEVDDQGNLWLATSAYNSGVVSNRILKYDGVDWSVEDENAPGIARKLFQDDNGTLWFEFNNSNTQERSYASYDGINWSYWAYSDLPTLPSTNWNPSAPLLYQVDSNGDWWMAHYSGIHEPKVYKINDSSYTAYNTEIFPLSTNYYDALNLDCDNNLWAGTSRFDGNNWDNFDYDQTGFSATVRNIATDPTNCDIWFALYGNSSSTPEPVGKYNGNEFETFSIGNGTTLGIDVSQEGIVYVATTQQGLGQIEDGNWTFFHEGNSPLHNFVKSVKVQSDGTVWASSYGNGVARKTGNTWTVFDNSNSPIDNHSGRLYLDNEDHIWTRSGSGIAKYNGTDWEVFSFGLGPSGVNYIAQDHLGNYWIATMSGALYWDGYDYTVYDVSNSNIGSNTIREIKIDSINGNIWFLHSTGFSVLQKFHIGNNLSGITFFDANQDGIFDSNEDVRLPGQSVILLPDSTVAITNSIGAYSFHPEDTGTYELVYEPVLPYINITPNSVDTLFSGQSIEGINFGAWTDNIPEGLSIDVVNGPLVCNNESNIWVTFQNNGFLNISGQVNLSFPYQFAYAGSYPEVATIESSEVSWVFEDLGFMESRTYKLVLQVPGVDALEEEFSFIAEIMVASNSKSSTVNDIVLCSYDPNDKTATPAGESVGNYSLLSDPLQYTIRFQNMGNYLAQDIYITDVIDPSLDLSTFKVISSSHEMTTTIESGRQVVFRFMDINLPPEEQDVLGSQGFIKYQISPNPGLPDPTEVYNFANIYFDLNPPIVTNTTENILVETLPTVSTQALNQDLKAMVYPNPATDNLTLRYSEKLSASSYFNIYNLTGIKVFTKEITAGSSNSQISPLSLPDGIYFYSINLTDGSEISTGKLIILK